MGKRKAPYSLGYLLFVAFPITFIWVGRLAPSSTIDPPPPARRGGEKKKFICGAVQLSENSNPLLFRIRGSSLRQNGFKVNSETYT